MRQRPCQSCGELFASVILWRRTCPACVPSYAEEMESRFAMIAQETMQREAEKQATRAEIGPVMRS